MEVKLHYVPVHINLKLSLGTVYIYVRAYNVRTIVKEKVYLLLYCMFVYSALL
jgi:hypothetical protein